MRRELTPEEAEAVAQAEAHDQADAEADKLGRESAEMQDREDQLTEASVARERQDAARWNNRT